jgi:hypothetical protein
MDKSQIITLVVNAIVTIMTTTAVIRLFFNHGGIGISPEFKTKLRTRFRTILYDLVMLGICSWALYRAIMKPEPPSRFTNSLFGLSTSFWVGKVGFDIGILMDQRKREKLRHRSN